MAENRFLILMHFIFETKGHEPTLALVDDASFDDMLRRAHVGLSAELLESGGDVDHRHVLAALPTSLAAAEYARRVKGALTRQLRAHADVDGGFAWAAGYRVYSVSSSRVDAVRVFVREQSRVHKRMSLREEVDELARRHASPEPAAHSAMPLPAAE